MLRVALDTNVLVYAEGVLRTPDDRPKIAASRRLISALVAKAQPLCVPAQALAETFSVLVKRGGFSAIEASTSIRRIVAVADVMPTTVDVIDAAMSLVVSHKLQVFDAVIMAAAAQAGCEVLVSEDLQDGFAWRGLVVAAPFGSVTDPRLAALMRQA